jgi:glucokinase
VRRALGIDIGGTAVKAGRLGPAGTIEAQLERPSPTREAPGAMVGLLADIALELAAVPPRQIPSAAGQARAGTGGLPLGIGCAGLVDPWRGVVLTSPNLPGWTEETPLADLVAQATGTRPVLLNDANAFVLAESRLGAGRGAATVVGITLGTGVGGGLVLDGKPWIGRHGAAGEVGHMPLLVDGPTCVCGGRGCLEALVGARAILARYGSLVRATRAGGVPAEPAGAEPLTVRRLAQRAEQGDAAATATFRETGRLLGLALAGLTQLLDPDLFVIGGGISRSAPLILPAARAALAEAAMLPPAMQPRVEQAALGSDAGWIGAARAAAESATGC